MVLFNNYNNFGIKILLNDYIKQIIIFIYYIFIILLKNIIIYLSN